MNISELEPHQKAWGAELWVENNDIYCCKVLILNAGHQCSLHKHRLKDETFLVLSGRLVMEIEGTETEMGPADFIRLRPETMHRFRGVERSVIVEISTHHDEADSYRVEPSV